VVLLLALAGPAAALPPTCTSWGEPTLLATCEDCPRLNESSGVVPARHRPGVWFTHNDAGGSAELYAFDTAGTHIETHRVTGGGFRDWEDLASGPCPDGVEAETCLYIGDVGDNGSTRDEVEIFVVAEPAEGSSPEVVASWRLRYPDEAHDCEAVVVHPCTGRVYLLTKERDGSPLVFRAPAEPTGSGSAGDLELIAILDKAWFGDSGLLTGADWSLGGDRLVLRTYDGGWAWTTDPAAPDGHWSRPPDTVPIDVEGQGEAIAFHPDGGVLTTTERVPMRISHLPCATSEEPPACPPPEPVDTGGPADSGGPEDSAAPGETGDPGTDDGDDGTDNTEAPSPTDSSAPPASTATTGSAGGQKGGCGSEAAWLWLVGLVGLAGLGRRRG
jgi:hypothetical protein